MKLQHKINIRFLLITSLVFIVAGIIFYVVLDKVISKNIDGMLKSRKEFVTVYLKTHTLPDSGFISPDYSLYIKPTQLKKKKRWLSDTLIYDEDEKELVSCRKINLITEVNHKNYEVTIIQSLVESDDLTEVIVNFMIILFLLILLSMFFLNQWLSISAWKPFFSSLEQLKYFRIGQKNKIHFNSTTIYEFDKLNQYLDQLIQKVQSDFKNLKEFTENASHEIQTPLAIIKSKLERVLQDKTLPEIHYQRIRAAYESAGRLSKLNEALLLLSKIENHQFVEQVNLDFCTLIKSRLEYLDELFSLKKIKLTVDLENPVFVNINPALADILINNLLSNALKHNIETGSIIISSGIKEITISNTGLPLPFDPEKMFQRFVKHTSSKESNGLGLAIAYEICKIYNLNLQYKYNDPFHQITINY
jgi:signal transduction histidine kinase